MFCVNRFPVWLNLLSSVLLQSGLTSVGCLYSFCADRISNFLSRQVSDIPRGIWKSSAPSPTSINSCFLRQVFECSAHSSGLSWKTWKLSSMTHTWNFILRQWHFRVTRNSPPWKAARCSSNFQPYMKPKRAITMLSIHGHNRIQINLY